MGAPEFGVEVSWASRGREGAGAIQTSDRLLELSDPQSMGGRGIGNPQLGTDLRAGARAAAGVRAAEYTRVDGRTLLTALVVAYPVRNRLSDLAPVRAKEFDHSTVRMPPVVSRGRPAATSDAARTRSQSRTPPSTERSAELERTASSLGLVVASLRRSATSTIARRRSPDRRAQSSSRPTPRTSPSAT
jgi:hypothetical protein